MVCTKPKTNLDGRATIDEYSKDGEQTRADAKIKNIMKITLLLLCTCFPHDTIDFSVQKQVKRR